jgi:hypothetical protein
VPGAPHPVPSADLTHVEGILDAISRLSDDQRAVLVGRLLRKETRTDWEEISL